MEGRRIRRFSRGNHHTLLPLRITHLNNTFSCWYCDFKSSVLNGPLFSFGRRYSRFLRVWFSVGIGVSLATLLGVTLVLLWELARDLHLFSGNYQLSSILSGSPFGYSPSVFSLTDVGYMCVSTLISVCAHELGHALAAASEGIQIEYVAVFLAVLFPGALVAFNDEMLQALPRVAALRIYCAGIWHNAVLCAVCALMLFLLPLILYPIYINGENPMVLDISSTSPLSGYISPGDLIVSLDGVRIHNAKEWMEMTVLLHKQTHKNSKGQSDFTGHTIVSGRKGYCVPSSLIEESRHTPFPDGQTTCPTELSTFSTIPCLPLSTLNGTTSEDNHQEKGESIYCLNARDVVELKKCGVGWIETTSNESSCPCLEEESCLAPVQMPGETWTEIKYINPSSQKCQPLGKQSYPRGNSSGFGEMGCDGTFVFIGDVISMAHSVWLTSYQPRWSFPFGSYVPVVVEKLLICTYDVSLMLALLNCLPVYFLDGECILEGALCFVRLRPRQRKTLLQSFLVGGTCISIIVIVTIFFSFILQHKKIVFLSLVS